MIHIHARDKDGKGVQDPAIYRRVKEGIRASGVRRHYQFYHWWNRRDDSRGKASVYRSRA